MKTTAEIRLWGTTIGGVYLPENSDVAFFEYDKNFIKSDIEISPIMMPLSNRVYSFPELSRSSFHGLPGLLSDSLPDKFGNAIINAWLAQQGRDAQSFNVIERLCYTGTRGMGALEYIPVSGPVATDYNNIELERLIKLASAILSEKSKLSITMQEPNDIAMRQILQIGTSAGGARAKAVIAWNEKTGEIRSGQIKATEGFKYWLIKFDGISNNKDKELADPQGFGCIEYAYYKLAQKASITMSECRILKEGERRHFITRRFDRTEKGEKIHMQSLAALAHYDFDLAGANSYEQAFAICRRLNIPEIEIEQLFRRMVFNIVFQNNDDHVKNISFLMDKTGKWRLSPAYDITYSYNPYGMWTSKHQMTINGKRENITLDDIKEIGKTARLIQGRAKSIALEISDLTNQWEEIANSAGVNGEMIKLISSNFVKYKSSK